MFGKISRSLFNFFLKGLLLLIPITITIWAVVSLFLFIDGLLKGYIDSFLGINIPGLGLLLLLLSITFIGFLGSSIIFKPIVSYFDKLLARAPLIKILYSSVKDLLSAFVGQKKRYTEPVRVRLFENSTIEKLGFVTNRDLSIIGVSNEKVAVYLPHSYAWSGNLLIVSAGQIKNIDAKPTDVMKFILSAGLIEIEEKK